VRDPLRIAGCASRGRLDTPGDRVPGHFSGCRHPGPQRNRAGAPNALRKPILGEDEQSATSRPARGGSPATSVPRGRSNPLDLPTEIKQVARPAASVGTTRTLLQEQIDGVGPLWSSPTACAAAPRRGCGPTRSPRRATSPRLHHALPRDDPSTRLTRAYGPHRTKSSGSTAGARRRRPPTEAVLITPSASSNQRRPQPAPGRRGSSRACSSHPESARMSRTRSARTRRKGPATK